MQWDPLRGFTESHSIQAISESGIAAEPVPLRRDRQVHQRGIVTANRLVEVLKRLIEPAQLPEEQRPLHRRRHRIENDSALGAVRVTAAEKR